MTSPGRLQSRSTDPTYPGDEPCECGAVTIAGHYLSWRVEGDPDVSHFRRSSGDACEETP